MYSHESFFPLGYWAKCVPENCFDVTNKLTYFYVDSNGELFLNTPTGEISLLTGKQKFISLDYRNSHSNF